MISKDKLLNAQVGVLGSMLLNGGIIGEVVSRVRDEDFTEPMYRNIYIAIRESFAAGEGVDVIVTLNKLRSHARFEEYRRLMAEIMEVTPTATQYAVYVEIMLEESKLYRARELFDVEKFPSTIDELRTLLDKANAITCDRPGLRVLTMHDGLTDFLERQGSRNKRDYLTWGFSDLDQELFAEAGDYIVLGGYPSAGKTALALQFACHMSKQKRVGFFSLETRDKKLFERMMAHLTQIGLPKIKRMELSDNDFESIACLTPRIEAQGLEFVEAAGMTAQEIQAVALSRRYEIIFIDYLQLIPSTGYNRTEEVTRISIALHTMAPRTGITVIALSQLTRPEKGQGKQQAPNMSSFRESGQIEQDADIALLLYLDRPDDNRSPRWLKVSKNKEGEKQKLLLEFNGAEQTFRKSYRAAPLPKVKAAGGETGEQVAFTELPTDTSVPFEGV